MERYDYDYRIGKLILTGVLGVLLLIVGSATTCYSVDRRLMGTALKQGLGAAEVRCLVSDINCGAAAAIGTLKVK